MLMNMKKIFTYVSLCLFALTFGQAPADYYNGTSGLEKAALKSKLAEIISNGHQDKSYDGLWTVYKSSDVDKYFENDGTLLDMYSENPNGKDPYTFKLGTNQCGNYTGEGSCYNREHTIPQSSFNRGTPMRSDAHHVVPTDGYVNNKRGTFPFGNTSDSPSWVSENGSKTGTSTVSGYSGTVFEPIDEFKGDFARIFFYFATRYESKLNSFSFPMLSKNAYPGLSAWSIPMLLTWHKEDPVDQREIDRNDAIYKFQGNRNPFIDQPNFAELIWGDATIDPVDPVDPNDSEAPTIPQELIAQNSTSTTVELIWLASSDNNEVKAYKIYSNGTLLKTVSSSDTSISSEEETFGILLSGLTPQTTYNFQVSAIDGSNNESDKSNSVTITTLAAEKPLATCGSEDFENIPVPSQPPASQYLFRTWTNKNITWTATEARTDKDAYINGDKNKSICMKGTLTSSLISGGISSLKLKTMLPYSDSKGDLAIFINGKKIGIIPYSTKAASTTISDINIEGNFIIEIKKDNNSSARVAIDDLSWTCYTTLSVDNVNINNKKLVAIPSKITNNQFYLDGLTDTENLQIFNISGQLVQTVSNVKNKDMITLKNLAKGIYIVQSNNQSTKIIID